jgi:AcrR family transcriptional regulator
MEAGRAEGTPAITPIAPRRRDKQASRRRILDAARLVFARDGYLDASLAEIAREAGLGKSSLYRHADSKAELYVEMLLDQVRAQGERLTRFAEGGGSAEEQLRLFAGDLFELWKEREGSRTLLWAVDNQDLIGEIPPRLLGQVREIWDGQLQTVAGLIRRGIESGEFRSCDPHVSAFLLVSLGQLLFDLSASPVRRRLLGVPIERAFEDCLALVLEGLRRR